MAEGFCRQLRSDEFNAFSAGIEKHGLNPLAVKVMHEAGVDISAQSSKTVRDLAGVEFDVVVAVCDHADESCPVLPGPARRIFHGFDDPPRLAMNARTEEEALRHYRRVRDEIKAYITDMNLTTESRQD